MARTLNTNPFYERPDLSQLVVNITFGVNVSINDQLRVQPWLAPATPAQQQAAAEAARLWFEPSRKKLQAIKPLFDAGASAFIKSYLQIFDLQKAVQETCNNADNLMDALEKDRIREDRSTNKALPAFRDFIVNCDTGIGKEWEELCAKGVGLVWNIFGEDNSYNEVLNPIITNALTNRETGLMRHMISFTDWPEEQITELRQQLTKLVEKEPNAAETVDAITNAILAINHQGEKANDEIEGLSELETEVDNLVLGAAKTTYAAARQRYLSKEGVRQAEALIGVRKKYEYHIYAALREDGRLHCPNFGERLKTWEAALYAHASHLRANLAAVGPVADALGRELASVHWQQTTLVIDSDRLAASITADVMRTFGPATTGFRAVFAATNLALNPHSHRPGLQTWIGDVTGIPNPKRKPPTQGD